MCVFNAKGIPNSRIGLCNGMTASTDTAGNREKKKKKPKHSKTATAQTKSNQMVGQPDNNNQELVFIVVNQYSMVNIPCIGSFPYLSLIHI